MKKAVLALSILLVLGLIAYFFKDRINQSETVSSQSNSKTQMTNTIPSGEAMWILYCENGLPTYKKNPYYTNSQGETKPKDAYMFGHFWILTETGKPYVYPEQEKRDCMEEAIRTVHDNGGKIWGSIAIDMDPGNATHEDVAEYIKRGADDPAVLQPIVDAVIELGYDGLINDIESGSNDDPTAFTQYNQNLKTLLKKANPDLTFGIALAPKTSDDMKQWQDWRALGQITDFQIIMALDYYQSSSDTPVATTNAEWIKEIHAYSSEALANQEKVAWELPKYCKLWEWDPEQGIWILKSWCDFTFVQTTLESLKDLRNPEEQILEDNSKDPQNPYIHYISDEGKEYYLFYESRSSLFYLTQTIHNLSAPSCIRMSYWDFDKGDVDTSDFNKKLKFC